MLTFLLVSCNSPARINSSNIKYTCRPINQVLIYTSIKNSNIHLTIHEEWHSHHTVKVDAIRISVIRRDVIIPCESWRPNPAHKRCWRSDLKSPQTDEYFQGRPARCPWCQHTLRKRGQRSVDKWPCVFETVPHNIRWESVKKLKYSISHRNNVQYKAGDKKINGSWDLGPSTEKKCQVISPRTYSWVSVCACQESRHIANSSYEIHEGAQYFLTLNTP